MPITVTSPPCRLISVPVQDGAGYPGCAAGPEALLSAGLTRALRALEHWVEVASVTPGPAGIATHRNPAIVGLPQIAAWTAALAEAAFEASATGWPIFLGGDHSLSAGTLSGMARRAAQLGRPLFVLWLDAHPDFHTLDTTVSGHLHGVPLAYAAGRPGFEPHLPPFVKPVDPAHICLLGVRSIDAAEAAALTECGIAAHSRQSRLGLETTLAGFLDQVRAAGGMLHVSLDVDFLDPVAAPAVGTPVADGVSPAEAFRLMEMLAQSRLVSSLDLVELNPTLDEGGRTATLMVDLATRLVGPARSATTAFAA